MSAPTRPPKLPHPAKPQPAPLAPHQPQLPAELLAVLAQINDPQTVMFVLADLLTPQEIEGLTERWRIGQLLVAGHTQRDIAAHLGVSVTTVSRGNRMLRYGPGGFAFALEQLAGLKGSGSGSDHAQTPGAQP